MTGLKVAIGVVGTATSLAGSITGGIMAQLPTLSAETPVVVTFGLVAGGLAGAAAFSWKVATAWAGMEARIKAIEARIARIDEEP